MAMKKQYEKMCVSCFHKYTGSHTATCPRCGRDNWIYVDNQDRQYHPVKAIYSAGPEDFRKGNKPDLR